MFVIFWIFSYAFAQEVTCDDLLKMLAVGMPETHVVEMIEAGSVTPELAACLAKGNAPEAVLTAARNAPVETPKVPVSSTPIPTPKQSPSLSPSSDHNNVTKPLESVSQLRHLALKDQIELQYQLPSRGVAAAFSILPGFGSGHFYAGSFETGTSFLLTDVAAITMIMSPVIFSPNENSRRVSAAGGILLFLSRLIATLTAPSFARKKALARFK